MSPLPAPRHGPFARRLARATDVSTRVTRRSNPQIHTRTLPPRMRVRATPLLHHSLPAQSEGEPPPPQGCLPESNLVNRQPGLPPRHPCHQITHAGHVTVPSTPVGRAATNEKIACYFSLIAYKKMARYFAIAAPPLMATNSFAPGS